MFDTIKRVSTFVPNEDNKPEPVARVGVDKQLPLPTNLDEVIADGVITRAGRRIPANQVVGVQLSPDERLLRVTTKHGSTDYDALPLATISGDHMRWTCPQVAERGLGIPELTTTEPQPVDDALFTAACALFDAGPIVIVPRVATPESRGVWKPLGKALDKWTTDEAQTDTDAIVVLANGIPSSARDAILAAGTYLMNNPAHATTRALATYLHRNPTQLQVHVHPAGHIVGVGDDNLDAMIAATKGPSENAQQRLMQAMGNTPPQLSPDFTHVLFPPSRQARCLPIATVAHGTWTWAWANPALPPSAAGKLTRFGRDKGLTPFTASYLPKKTADDLHLTDAAKYVFGLPGHAWVPLGAETSILVLFDPQEAGM